MFTKTKKVPQKKSDPKKGHSFSIPKEIQKKIDERGFYLYEWIGSKDLKNSLKESYIDILLKIGPFFGILIILYGVFSSFSSWLNKDNIEIYDIISSYLFWFILGTFIGIVFIYILYSLIIKTKLFYKNNFIIFTTKFALIEGKILDFQKSGILPGSIHKVGKVFYEPLFGESRLEEKNKIGIKKIKEMINKGYDFINDKNSKKRPLEKVFIISLIGNIFYSIYVALIWFIYYAGVFILWLLGLFVSIIIKWILLITGHRITIINNSFESIYESSIGLKKEKKELIGLLKEASNNDWKNSLSRKINKNIALLNRHALSSTKDSLKLKKNIKTSKYKEMFDFSIYNSWIKKQIEIPLEQIKNLLEKNIELLKKNKEEINKKINNTSNIKLKGPLELSLKRTIMSIDNLNINKKQIEIYLDKLR